MSKKYLWVNLNKREYLNPRDFYCSRGLWGTAYVKEEMANTVVTLLAEDWRGDLVVFLEEGIRYYPDNNKVNDLLRDLQKEFCADNSYDAIEQHYRNIGVLYSISEDIVKRNPSDYELESYKQLFYKEPGFYRYIINQSRMEYIDRERLAAEPTPALFAVTSKDDDDYSKDELGCWIGDDIYISNELPEGKWTDASLKYFVGYIGFYTKGKDEYKINLFSEVNPDKEKIERCIRVLKETDTLIQKRKKDLLEGKPIQVMFRVSSLLDYFPE